MSELAETTQAQIKPVTASFGKTIYMSAIRYGGDFWTAGPSGDTAESVVEQLRGWSGLSTYQVFRIDNLPLDEPEIPEAGLQP